MKRSENLPRAAAALVLALAAALCASFSITGFAKVNCTNFSSWFTPDYNEMNQLNLIPASFEGLDLKANITRREMCELAVHAYELITKNTIDEDVLLALTKKEKTQDALIDAVKANLEVMR